MPRRIGEPPPIGAFDVEKELDAVVGKFEDRRGALVHRIGRIAARALLGASLAIAAVTVVIYTLHSHVKQAQTARPPAKAPPVSGTPVEVQILPAK